jgi:hypothetical protein
MTDQQPDITEEELREQLSRVRVQDVVIQTVVSIINLAAAKAEDREQLRVGIEAARALLPLVEAELGEEAASFRDAISQLQLAYAKGPEAVAARSAPGGESSQPPPAAEPDPASGPGPAQSSGRLWIPGQ